MKKMLVPFDEAKPGKRINDFIYPKISEATAFFAGIKKPKEWTKGMVVYTGVEITADDIFAKIVDAGTKIDDVDRLIADLKTYVSQLSQFTIGNVLEIEKDDQTRFNLKKFADRINPSETSKIP